VRRLEIGPGKRRLPGFETLDLKPGVDHQADASKLLPFDDNTFELIYASHIIEHIPWFETINTLKEWRRVLAPGGKLEIWTIDAAKVAKYLLEYESGERSEIPDKWRRFNHEANPFKWANGRIFAYGASRCDPYWHKALFTPRYLLQCFEEAGFIASYVMDRSEVRGKDHGHVNLGVSGRKF
jgi:SAM-dependent methyltransferase